MANFKQFSLNDRIIIQSELNSGKSLKTIAEQLGKASSSQIGRSEDTSSIREAAVTAGSSTTAAAVIPVPLKTSAKEFSHVRASYAAVAGNARVFAPPNVKKLARG
jgi:hypothetical protein